MFWAKLQGLNHDGSYSTTFSVTFVNISKCSDVITMSLRKTNIYHILQKFFFYTSPSYILVDLDTHVVVISIILVTRLHTSQCIDFTIEFLKPNAFKINSATVFLSGHFSKFAWLNVVLYTNRMSLKFRSVKFIPGILAITI